LSASELIAAAQGGGTLGKGASLSAEVYVDPATGNRYKSGYDNSGRVALVNIQGGAPFKGDPKSLTLQSIGTAQARADIGLITELKKKHGTNVLDAEKDYVSLNGPFKSAGDRAEFRQAYGFDLAVPAGAGGAGTATQGGAATAGGAPAGGSNVNVPLAQQQRQAAGQKDIVTEAAKQVAASADTQNMLKSINTVTGLLDSGKHNVGSALSGFVGRGPVAQAIGTQFETDDAKNTKTIMDTVNKLAADGLKALGSNPSTVDLEFWTRFKPVVALATATLALLLVALAMLPVVVSVATTVLAVVPILATSPVVIAVPVMLPPGTTGVIGVPVTVPLVTLFKVMLPGATAPGTPVPTTALPKITLFRI